MPKRQAPAEASACEDRNFADFINRIVYGDGRVGKARFTSGTQTSRFFRSQTRFRLVSSRAPRLGLLFVAATVVLGGLLASTPVLSSPVGLCIGANVAAAFVAVRELRRLGSSARVGAGFLRTGLFVGGTVALIGASALVAPAFIEGLAGAEARLSVQLLILSAGFAAALLAWWGREHLRSDAPTT